MACAASFVKDDEYGVARRRAVVRTRVAHSAYLGELFKVCVGCCLCGAALIELLRAFLLTLRYTSHLA